MTDTGQPGKAPLDWKQAAFLIAEEILSVGNYQWSPQELVHHCRVALEARRRPKYGDHTCTCCGVEWVDADTGEDTCAACLKRA